MSVYTLIKIILRAHLSSYQFCDISVSLVSLTHARQPNTSGSLCVRLDVFLNLCTCVFVCVRVVCVAVPIVRWRSVRCAAVRRPLSSSLLALSQASRQLPEMQDSVLGKEILVLFPAPRPPPPPLTHLHRTPSSYTQLWQVFSEHHHLLTLTRESWSGCLFFLLGNHSFDVDTKQV